MSENINWRFDGIEKQDDGSTLLSLRTDSTATGMDIVPPLHGNLRVVLAESLTTLRAKLGEVERERSGIREEFGILAAAFAGVGVALGFDADDPNVDPPAVLGAAMRAVERATAAEARVRDVEQDVRRWKNAAEELEAERDRARNAAWVAVEGGARVWEKEHALLVEAHARIAALEEALREAASTLREIDASRADPIGPAQHAAVAELRRVIAVVTDALLAPEAVGETVCTHPEIVPAKEHDDGSIDGRCTTCGDDTFPIRDVGYEEFVRTAPEKEEVDSGS